MSEGYPHLRSEKGVPAVFISEGCARYRYVRGCMCARCVYLRGVCPLRLSQRGVPATVMSEGVCVPATVMSEGCLLYTSDAADER